MSRVLFVSKKSVYDRQINDTKDGHFAKLVAEGHPSVDRMRRSEDAHRACLEEAKSIADRLGLDATFCVVGDEESSPVDLVITLGGDGTLLWVSHIVGTGVPTLAINTVPDESIGYFCGGTSRDLSTAIEGALDGKLSKTLLTRMRVDLDDKTISHRVLNDMLFSHRIPAATTRYVLSLAGRTEDHKSSGIWVGTAAGSTAALRSAGGKVMPLRSEKLQFVVREPYLGTKTRFRIVKGMVLPDQELTILSETPEGYVYLDGPYREHPVPFGATLTVRLSGQPLTLLGLSPREAD
ncbi:MAG: NAD(+)/NADH kinase [Myxococcales bacterium]|nr:NAD(+)/NADH kinase [Myxococcales bacterium]